MRQKRNRKEEAIILQAPIRNETVDYFIKYIIPKRKTFDSFQEKLIFLTTNDYIDQNLYTRYHPIEIEQLYLRAKSHGIQFDSIDHMRIFYSDYALKERNTHHYLEDLEDRYVWTALHLGNGDSVEALRALDDLLKGVIPPLTVFINAGKVEGHSRLEKTSGRIESVFFSTPNEVDRDQDIVSQ